MIPWAFSVAIVVSSVTSPPMPQSLPWTIHGEVSVVDVHHDIPGRWFDIDNDPTRRPASYVTADDPEIGRFAGDFTIDVSFTLRTIGPAWSTYNGTPRIITRPGEDQFYNAAFYIQVESHGDKGNLLNCGFYNGKSWDEVRMGDEAGESGIAVGTPYRVVVQYAAACSSLTAWVFQLPADRPFFAQRVWRVRPPRSSGLPVHIGYGGPGSTDSWLDGSVGRIIMADSLMELDFANALPLTPPPLRTLPLTAERIDARRVLLSWPRGWGDRFSIMRAPAPDGPWGELAAVADTQWVDRMSLPGAYYEVVPEHPPDSVHVASTPRRPPAEPPRVRIVERFPSSCAVRVASVAPHLEVAQGPTASGPWRPILRSPNRGLLSVVTDTERGRYLVVRGIASDGSRGPACPALKLADSPNRPAVQWAQLPVLVVLFRHGPHDSIPRDEVERLKRGMELTRLFYWRNSGCQLNLDLHFLVVDAPLQPEDYAQDGILWPGFIEPLLRRAKIMPEEFGVVFALFPPLEGGGNYGGMTIFNDVGYSLATYPPRTGVVYPGTDPAINYAITWLFCHELQHSVDLVAYEGSGYEAMWHGDRPLDCAVHEGQEFSYQAGIFRHFTDYTRLGRQWGLILESWDRDSDGIPDEDPRVPLDENRLGSSPKKPDTDGDGLSDKAELMAGIYSASDPRKADTDRDGIPDGSDPLPLLGLATGVGHRNVVIDGSLDNGWQPQGASLSWSATSDFVVATHLAWDSSGLAIGLRLSKPSKVVVELDAGFDGWWHAKDNVLLVWYPQPDTIGVRVMDTTLEARAFREKEIGYAVEAWDNSPSYIATFGRLVQPSAVHHASRRLPSGEVELEVLLPSEPRIGFVPAPGDTVGLAIHFPQIPATLLERYELGSFVLE